jgi:hypothetical protein
MSFAEINGMCGVQVGGKSRGVTQELVVVDGDGFVWIRPSEYGAVGLTPDQAEWLIKKIAASARRVREKMSNGASK